jgi:2-polyprenyl-3-methyl-5-hydroxy-6-metoxy-1,4-benzoquinol methylase
MLKVTHCPYCNQKERVKVMTQNFPDIYINLINPKLNNIARYWYECTNCRFLYRSPKLDQREQEVLYKKYRDESFRSETPDEYFDRIVGYDNFKSENFQKVSWLLKNIEKSVLQKSKTILDIGCGGGVLLHKVKNMIPYLSTYGIEPNELYSSLARRRSGAKEILTAYFGSKAFVNKFDIVISSDVLEHVDKPDFFLKDVYNSLNENGIFFLGVPLSKVRPNFRTAT